MGFGGALLALSAVQAVGQIGAGRAQEAEAKYNASVLESQKMLMGVEQDIEIGRIQRMKGKQLGQSMTAIAGMGIMPEGSSMAAIVGAQTQFNIDQAITNFNYEREKLYTQSQADAERRRGKSAKRAGWSNAFSTMLQGGASYAMYKGMGQGSKIQTTGFDSIQPIPKYKSIRSQFSSNTALPAWATF